MPRQLPPRICPPRLRGLITVPTSATAVYSMSAHDAGLDVHFHFGEADDVRVGLAVVRDRCPWPRPSARGRPAPWPRPGSSRGCRPAARGRRSAPPSAIARVAACANVRPRPARRGEHAPVGRPRSRRPRRRDRAAAIACSLRDGVVRRGVVGAGHRVDGLAAVRGAGPRQVLAGVAPDHLDVVPRHAEDVGGDPRDVDHRVGAEIAGARLHVQRAVGPDRAAGRRSSPSSRR